MPRKPHPSDTCPPSQSNRRRNLWSPESSGVSRLKNPYMETIAIIDYMNTRIEELRTMARVDATILYEDIVSCFHGKAPTFHIVMADLSMYYGMREIHVSLRSAHPSAYWVSFAT